MHHVSRIDTRPFTPARCNHLQHHLASFPFHYSVNCVLLVISCVATMYVPLSTMKGKSCVPLARLLDPLLISCHFLIVLWICPLCHPFHSPRCKHFEYIQVFMCDGSPYIPWHCSNSFNGHQLLLWVFIFLYTLDCNLYVSSTGISISIQSFLNRYVKTFSLWFF